MRGARLTSHRDWQAAERGLPQPASSLLSLPEGEKIKESSQLLFRVLEMNITAIARKLPFPHLPGVGTAPTMQFQGRDL